MAKLSAHGTEVRRLIIDISRTEPAWDGDTSDAERLTYSVRSDGAVLVKRAVHNLHGDGTWTVWDWKLYLRKGETKRRPPAEVAEVLTAAFQTFVDKRAPHASMTVKPGGIY